MIGILIDGDTNDLQVKHGSLSVGDNTELVAQCVIMASKGEFKEHPLIGADITKLINSNGDALWCANAKEMLLACGVPVKRVRMEDNQITIE